MERVGGEGGLRRCMERVGRQSGLRRWVGMHVERGLEGVLVEYLIGWGGKRIYDRVCCRVSSGV